LRLETLGARIGQVEQRLPALPEQLVEPVDLGPRVRQRRARVHQPRERVGIQFVERGQHVEDRVPGVLPAGDEPAAGEVGAEPAVPLDHCRDVRAVRRRIRLERGDVEDAHVLRQAGGDEADVEPRDQPCRHLGSLLDEHLEPHAEAFGVELLVEAGLGAAPQIQIEDAGDLRRRRQHHQRTAGLEPTAIDDAVQGVGRQPRHHFGDAWRVEDLVEQGAAITTDQRGLAGALLHATSGKRVNDGFPWDGSPSVGKARPEEQSVFAAPAVLH
jgi:hypothetical protein